MAASRVAVVGAGLAGLSAALELKQAGCHVTLFERSRLLGGKATSFEVDGIEVDNGQHVYLACCTEFIDFVDQVTQANGLGTTAGASSLFPASPLHLQRRFDALLFRRGERPARLRAAPLPAPLHLAPAILSYRYLPFADRLRIGLAIIAARRPPRRNQTFAAWLSRHGQRKKSRAAFWDPFLVPALNAPLEEVSAEDALFVIRTAFLGDAGAARFGYATVPLARIAEAAADRLDEVHLRTPVTEVSPPQLEPNGTSVTLTLGSESRAFDGAVLAVPPDRLQGILKPPEAFGVSGLGDFRTAPIVDVHLWYDIPAIGFDFAALLDSPIQWIFEKGPGYLCCSMSAADAYIRSSRDELVELCYRELISLLPELREARLLRGAATRDREATFIPALGLLRPGPLTNDPRLVIAGAWTDTGWPATMESAVRSGRTAARALLVQTSS